jgi:O-antigen/teichoic acid export membrane protein
LFGIGHHELIVNCEVYYVSVKSKLIKNTIINHGIKFWSFIITFILFWFIANKIGETDYGIYFFVSAITGYFGILNLGIGNTLIKFVAEYHAKDDKEKLNEVINTAFFMFIVVGVIGAAILFIIGTFLLGYLSEVMTTLDTPDFYHKARAIMYIIAINFTFSLALASLNGVLSGLQRYDILAGITFVMSIVNVIVVFIVLSMGNGVIELVFYTIITGLFSFIIVAYFIQKLLPYVTLSRKYVNRGMFRQLFDLGISVFLLSIFVMVIYYTDRLVIGLFVGISLITFYQAAWKVQGISSKVSEIGIRAMIPAASELDAKKNFRGIREMYLRGTKYVLAFCLALAVPVIFLSREILTLWMGSDYSQYYVIVIILTIVLFFDLNNYVASQILIGMNKIKRFVKYYGITAVLNLGLSLYLVREGYGLEGVALGTAIPFAIMEVFFLRHALKVLEIKWRTYAGRVIVRTFPFAGLTALLMAALLFIHKPEVRDPVGLMDTIFASIVPGLYFIAGCGTFFILFYYKGLEPHEKEDFKNILNKLNPRRKFKRKAESNTEEEPEDMR